MTAAPTIWGAGGFAAAWTVLMLVGSRSALSNRRLRLMSVLLAVLSPAAADLWLAADAKYALAAAVAAPLPGLAAGHLHAARRGWLDPPDLNRNPLSPFALLYAAAATYGLAWALIRGNELGLALGQSWAAALFFGGFLVAGPLVARRAAPLFWLLLAAGVALLALPALAPFAAWLGGGGPEFMRLLDRSAFLATVSLVLTLSVVRAAYPRPAEALGAVLALVVLLTFTRSYWLGGVAGVATLAALWPLRALRREPRRIPALRRALVPALAAGAAIALLLATPVGAFALERVTMTQSGSGDVSVDVRAFELSAALDAVRASLPLGVGSGGRFLSLYQTGPDEALYGATNFLHNAYLYFPLKFGVLGLAAVFALAAGLAVAAARRIRHPDLRECGFLAAFVTVLAASLTAPNLVDPSYSLFAGMLAYLAGGVEPAVPRAGGASCARV